MVKQADGDAAGSPPTAAIAFARRAYDAALAVTRPARSAVEGRYAALSDERKRLLARGFSISFFIFIAWILFNQLRTADWSAIAASLPSSPWFYIFFLMRYLLVPVTEALVYGVIWARNFFVDFGVLLKKRVLNFSVGAQAGDVWFVFWAAQRLQIRKRDAFSAVKDVTMLSAAASNVVAALLLAFYAVFGERGAFDAAGGNVLAWVSAAVAGGLLISALALWWRGGLIRLPRPKGVFVGVAHAGRCLINLALLGAQWSAGLPGVSAIAWLNFLVVDMLVARAPLIPGKDLVFLSLALSLTASVNAPETALTAMFIANTALSQIAAATSFALATLWRNDGPDAAPAQPTDDAPGLLKAAATGAVREPSGLPSK
ncbi:MAG: hypothetical protein ACFB00_10935 [Parvularculaceae bacterium]